MIIGADFTGMTLTNTDSNPFWDFSLHLYGCDGVADACIQLQETAAVDVNVLLYCVWRAAQGISMTEVELQAVDSLISDWREDVVRPIRALRQYLKGRPGVESSRARVKEAELEAERIQQGTMYEHACHLQVEANRGSIPLQHNLSEFARFQGIELSGLAVFIRAVEPCL
jgi:uncharacterized protein (TIGR02444 family)